MFPIIGVTPDFALNGSYSAYPYFQLRQTYLNCIIQAGGIPLILPYSTNIDGFINIIDGIVLTGGDFDISPNLYGDSQLNKHTKVNSERTEFEWGILNRALETNMPILGICAGEQLINVALGGNLIQHIPDEVEAPLNHEQTTPKHEVSHSINIVPNTLLYKIVNTNKMMVNSTHHQAVKDVGKNLIVSAIAPDGVIEAIEHTYHPFCLGVQWHPDHIPTEEDSNILKYFITKCTEFKKNKL
ncbi:gamma-glutamyl-gamma-aminobutyrate hydrolase family protein [Rickettsiales endosymbiont of Stachyamoeba lipophora]|nr:gamma-glutamyl-gamma-aminobutyrate hydrolase family protein [Rickettsiales endosymbiont of Stachyamoeba lipophora]